MRWYDRLERRFGKFAIAHITLALVFGQSALYAVFYMQPPGALDGFLFVPAVVAQGEVWRVFSFLLVPLFTNLLFFIIGIMLFYTMGTALEHEWGDFRFNLYLLIGWAATVGTAFLRPDAVVSNRYLLGSIYLAFAYLYPNFEIQMMMILPMKVRWVAWLTWGYYAYLIIFGDGATRILVLASTLNFFIFFGVQIMTELKWLQRRSVRQAGVAADTRRFRRELNARACAVCGRGENDGAELRYCSQCGDAVCYCPDHIRDHEHVQ